MRLLEEIAALKAERKAVVLAHNYCRGEVQDAADFTGDSLELSRKATQVEAEVIVFCGVKFMAETAKILNPGKLVLMPEPTAGCPMAEMITGEQLRQLKAAHPKAKAVCYVNSTAEVKAECDMCVTSGNAERVMRTFAPEEEIIFVPDCHLGGYIAGKLGRTYMLWDGYCPIHAQLKAEEIKRLAGAEVLVHPECSAAVCAAADRCLSTGGMCAYVRQSPVKTFVIGTERGILHRLRKENPEKTFLPAGELVCADMKKVTLEKLRDALKFRQYEVTVPEDVALRARRAIEAMLACG